MHKLFPLHTLARCPVQSRWSCKFVASLYQTPLQNLWNIWPMRYFYPKKPTLLVLILKCAAVRQANGHQLDMGDCFREEGPVQLHEGNVMVAFVQHFWLVSLVDNHFFNTPESRIRKTSTFWQLIRIKMTRCTMQLFAGATNR